MSKADSQRIVVAGHICLDVTPKFQSEKGSELQDIMIPGKLIQMNGVNVHTGGVVANTGLALKKLGADVTLMGKVGDDAFGTMVLDLLKRHGAADGMQVVKGARTSYSVVVAPPGIDRIFLHDPGANHTFCVDDLDFNQIGAAALFHFGYPPLMKRMYERNGEELEEMFRRVKSLGVSTSLDMAAVDGDSEAGKADWSEIIRRVIPYVDYFVPSAEELAFMIDRPLYEKWLRRAKGGDMTDVISIEEEILPLADRLLNWGGKVILIKCGSRGLCLRTAGIEVLTEIGKGRPNSLEDFSDQSLFEESYCPGQVVSATGAGDTSIAAFLLAILSGYDCRRCVQLACGTGASCVEAYDSLSGIRSFEELNTRIDLGWQKLKR